ncbi:MAG: hypothetical protein HWE16_04870 [Gammaproteobacteria bacterium]|nr:hypothetical protein [Gammaproteobacteria bacterium]
MKALVLSALFLVTAGCATTQAPMSVAKSEATQETTQETAQKDTKVKCSTTRATGSQMKKKRCWDKKEYEEMKEQSKEYLRRATEAGTHRNPIN